MECENIGSLKEMTMAFGWEKVLGFSVIESERTNSIKANMSRGNKVNGCMALT